MVALILIIGGAFVIPSIVATGEDSLLERLGDLIDASSKTDGSNEERTLDETQEEAVASVNGQFIYQEDVDYEKAYSMLYSEVEITSEEAIKFVAIKKSYLQRQTNWDLLLVILRLMK